jgi:hypothetical protein
MNLTSGDERRLRALENGMLRGVPSSKRDEVMGAGGWGKPYNEELHNL